MLYGQNLFVLTREVSESPGMMNSPTQVADFFGELHLIPDGGPVIGGTFVRRSELIKRAEIRDADTNYPGFDLSGSIPPGLLGSEGSNID